MLIQDFLDQVNAMVDSSVKHIRFATGPDDVLDVLSIYTDESGTLWVDLDDQEAFED